MAKINTIGRRLKSRLNWNSTFKTQSIKNFGKICLTNLKIYNATRKIMQEENMYLNEPFVVQENKKLTFNAKIINKSDNYMRMKNNSEYDIHQNVINQILEITSQKLEKFMFINKKFNIEFSNVFFQEPQKLDNNQINQRNYNFLRKNHFLILSPKFLTQFIMTDLKQAPEKQYFKFNENLKNNISRFCKQLLNIFKTNILGIKIMFSGKWKKTKTGRKQKFIIKFGRNQSNTINEIILFDWLNQRTKYGSCSIKIWITIRKNIIFD